MFSSSFTVACFAAVLPVCLTTSRESFLWASVEAQAEYSLTEDAVTGSKCSIDSKTFQIRADGSWLEASAYDLRGNFDEDCSIHVTLTIPENDPEVFLMLEIKELQEKKIKLESDRKDLLKEIKKWPSIEGALLNEMEEYESKMKELRKEKEALEEKKAEYNEKKSYVDRQNQRKGAIDVKRKKLDEKKNQSYKLSKEENLTNEIRNMTEEKERLKSELQAKIERISDIDYLTIVNLYPNITDEEKIFVYTPSVPDTKL